MKDEITTLEPNLNLTVSQLADKELERLHNLIASNNQVDFAKERIKAIHDSIFNYRLLVPAGSGIKYK